jgi:hypothetical protein
MSEKKKWKIKKRTIRDGERTRKETENQSIKMLLPEPS